MSVYPNLLKVQSMDAVGEIYEHTKVVNTDLITAAKKFCVEAHKGQLRKYTKDPYYLHPFVVADMASKVLTEDWQYVVALLHDVVEDTSITYQDIRDAFGHNVMEGVMWLTDDEEGNRATRKQLACERIWKAPAYIQNIKCCDILHNCESIYKYDPKFGVAFQKECMKMLIGMTKADKDLLEHVKFIVEDDRWKMEAKEKGLL